MVKTNGSHWMCNKSIMYLNELVDDFVFGTNHGLNLIDCKPLSYTYTSNWIWGWKELYKWQTQKSVYAMHSTTLRGLFDLQKCAKTTQNKTKTILHLYFNSVESRPIYAKLKFGSIWHDGRTNKRGGGGWTLNLFLSTSSSDYPRTGVFHQLQQLSTRK